MGALGMNLWVQQEEASSTTVGMQNQIPAKSSFAVGSSSIGEPTEMEGWHPIHVFYGEKSGLFNDAPASITESQESFAQVGQDSIILDLLGPNGYFIDLAASKF